MRGGNWCLAYNRRALFNDDRLLGPEAITANGVKVQLSQHAQSAIRLKRDAMAGKVFKVTFTKFNSVECFCLCCVGCCLCCEPLVLEDTIAINKIWYGHIPQTPCLDCPPLTRALLCCLPLFGCCEERVNVNIKDVAYVGAPEQQYMGLRTTPVTARRGRHEGGKEECGGADVHGQWKRRRNPAADGRGRDERPCRVGRAQVCSIGHAAYNLCSRPLTGTIIRSDSDKCSTTLHGPVPHDAHDARARSGSALSLALHWHLSTRKDF